MKTAQHYLDEANAIVPKLTALDAIKVHATDTGVFVDVRDSADIAKTGTIKGALRIPRGFLEFAACTDMGFHNAALQKDANIYLVCGLGGQAALSGRTLIDMGYKCVTNVGGIGDWEKFDGPMEHS